MDFENFKRVFINEIATQRYKFYPDLSLFVWSRLFRLLCNTEEATETPLESDSSETYEEISKFFNKNKDTPVVKDFLVEQIKLLGDQNGHGKTNLEKHTIYDLKEKCGVSISNVDMGYPEDEEPLIIGGYRKRQSIKTKKRKNIKKKKYKSKGKQKRSKRTRKSKKIKKSR